MRRDLVLAALNGRILHAYSQRTIQGLRAHVPLRVVLPHLEPILAQNIEKEARKDALVMQCASGAVRARTRPEHSAIRQLLAAGKAVDQAFLARIESFPIRIVIRYEDIEPLRARRIECLLDAAYRIMDAWLSSTGLRAALRASFAQLEFERRLNEILRLYALETQTLGRAVRLPLPLVPLREVIAQRLLATMNDVAARLTYDVARGAYRVGR